MLGTKEMFGIVVGNVRHINQIEDCGAMDTHIFMLIRKWWFPVALTYFAVLASRATGGDEWLRLRSGAARHLPRYSHRLNGLIERCLHPDPAERPTAKKLLTDLEIIIDRSVPVLLPCGLCMYEVQLIF